MPEKEDERTIMNNWQNYGSDQTIPEFEYTRRAQTSIENVISSEEFANMDAEMIYTCMRENMKVIGFSDYLKRYIHGKMKMKKQISEVEDAVYFQIIKESFEYNEAPFSFTEITTKKNAIIRNWLKAATIRRSGVFVLGFGLRMTPEEVSAFLTKGLQEEDFDFSDPKEVIYWYCYCHAYPYVRTITLWNIYEKLEPMEGTEETWRPMYAEPKKFLLSEENLLVYLRMLKYRGIAQTIQETAYQEFLQLYGQCQTIISDMHNLDAEFIDQKEGTARPADIGPDELEKVFCSGMPTDRRGALQTISDSTLSSLFKSKRMTGHRIWRILRRKDKVGRFDLITLLFFIYAQTVEPYWPAERYLQYIDAANELLGKCSMHGIYPANPYEAFVLMCLVTDDPLDTYAEIWSMSFENVAIHS